MRQEDDMSQGRQTGTLTRTAWRHLGKNEIDRRIESICAEVARAFDRVESERIECQAGVIYAKPIDNRRLIRIMSRYMSFN